MTSEQPGRGPWPTTSSVPQVWRSASGVDRDAGRSYAASMPARIAERSPRVDPGTRTLAHDATIELARFDAELGHRVQAFGPLLLRSEAASSSQIENFTASARSVLSAELGGRGSRNAEQVVANARAMHAALELADDVSARSILRMHEVLMAGQPRHRPGRWREQPVWIGTSSASPFGASFVAPPAEAVPDLIDDCVAFAHRDDVESLVRSAIAHAQFETIHPFTDGNGRTGRALVQSMLRGSGVTTSVAVPVSAGLLADVEGYHRALDAYRAGDVHPIIEAFAHAASRAVVNSRGLVTEIDAARAAWDERLSVRRSSNAWRLLDAFAAAPVLTAAAAAERIGVARPNVYPPLRALADAGIVRSKHEHELGDSLWRADDILAALDRFAERSGRRTR